MAILIGGKRHKNLGGTISKGNKSEGAPMVKIKDFTLALKIWGRVRALRAYSTPAHGYTTGFK